MNDIAIALAPTGGWGEGENNPVTPEHIAEQVIAGAHAGASIVHIHSRDARGTLTADRSAFDETVRIIKERCDIVLEASTGGLSPLTAEERVVPTGNPSAELGSLNIGSLNFGDEVYCNSLPDVRLWMKRMGEHGVRPSLEIFDTGHLETARALIDEGSIEPPYLFNLIFGVRWGMPFDPALLAYLIGRLPRNSRWGVTLIESRTFEPHLAAARVGADIVRCGFEDSRTYGGGIAQDNLELVRELRHSLEGSGFRILSAAQVRDKIIR